MKDAPARGASGAARPPLGEALEFMRLLWAVDHGLHRRSKRMAVTLGITGPQRLALRILGRFPGLSAGDLARVLHLHPSTLTGILDRLAAKGVLARRTDPDDRRRAVLELSAAGHRLDVEATGTIESIVKQVLAGRSEREVRAAREVLGALAAGLADDLAGPGPAARRAVRSRRSPAE
jgi:DNA-binding MarR family transcriptional regulator